MNCPRFWIIFDKSFSINFLDRCYLLQVIMIEETNGNNTINVKVSPNSVIPIVSSASNDDLSLESASEYTDADESMSAPTEYLAEVSVQC